MGHTAAVIRTLSDITKNCVGKQLNSKVMWIGMIIKYNPVQNN
jgi:phage-related holin